jgi:hypothetical protein
LPLGKFIFLHLVVLVFFAFSISFLAARISVRTALPHVCDFFSGSWSSFSFLFVLRPLVSERP